MKGLYTRSCTILLVILAGLMSGCGGGGASSVNVNLSALTLTSGTLEQLFQSTQLDYTSTQGFLITNLCVIATAEDPGATIEVNGNTVASGETSSTIVLAEGANIINIVVTGVDGVSTQSYTVTVTRLTNANLSALTLTSGTLEQPFQSTQLDYTSTQGFLIASLRVIATTEDPGATIEVNGNSVASGETSATIVLAEGANIINIVVTGVDGVATQTYTVTVTRQTVVDFAQQAYVKASNTGANDQFGYNLALSGDTLAVGAIFEDSNTTGVNGNQADNSASASGAVYVFTRSNGVWSQQAYIKASNTGAGNQFGWSIALSGDTLTVGAPSEDSNATGINGDQANILAPNSGAVYVFTRSNGVWSQQAYIKASNTGADDQFGYSVALSGDTLTVGVPSEDSNATGIDGDQADNGAASSGAAYVFTRSNGVWSQQAYIKASNTGTGDLFGYSVALSGDNLTVGTSNEDSNATGIDGDQADNSAAGSGAVYIFTRSNGVWSQQAYIKASNTEAGDLFGSRVALSGDTLLVGASGEDSNTSGDQTNNLAPNSGAGYVFTRSNGIWSQQAYIKALSPGVGDAFGWSVGLSGDTLIVGALLEASNATGINGNQADDSTVNSGAVYVFTRNNGVWSQQAYIKASNTGADDRFGWSVALSGGTLAAGATLESSNAAGIDGNQADNSASGSGVVYVFR